MNADEKPAWMKDPAVSSIDEKKLDFLQSMVAGGQGKNQKEVMAYLMTMMKKAKAENLTFTQEEMSVMMSTIRKYSSPEELEKLDKLLKKKHP